MITKDRARALADAYLHRAPREFEVVILDDYTQDHDWCWVFFYNSRKYVETGEVGYALAGNGPILVDKRNREIQQIPPVLAIQDMKKAVDQAKRREFTVDSR